MKDTSEKNKKVSCTSGTTTDSTIDDAFGVHYHQVEHNQSGSCSSRADTLGRSKLGDPYIKGSGAGDIGTITWHEASSAHDGKYGWICPRCGKVNSPSIAQCPCPSWPNPYPYMYDPYQYTWTSDDQSITWYTTDDDGSDFVYH